MKKLLKIIGIIITIPIIILSIFVSVRMLCCVPNKGVIKTIKPITQIVANDIVKHGIPTTLSDIKGVPYELQGCIREEIYKKNTSNRNVMQSREEADYVIIKEDCYFVKDGTSYEVWFWFAKHFKDQRTTHGTVRIYNKDTYTGLSAHLNVDNNGTYKYSIGNGFAKEHGVLCGSFKQ